MFPSQTIKVEPNMQFDNDQLLHHGNIYSNSGMDNNQNTSYWLPPQEPSTSASSVASSPPVDGDLRKTKKGKKKESKSANAKRSRISYTSRQLMALEREYAANKYLNRMQRFTLANALLLKEEHVKVWFQNRRMKDRQAPKKKQRHLRGTSSSAGSSSPISDDFENVSLEDGNHSSCNNSPRSIIPTTVPKRNMNYNYDQHQPIIYVNNVINNVISGNTMNTNNINCGNNINSGNNNVNSLFPLNNNQCDYTNSNNEHMGPIPRTNANGQHTPSAPLNELVNTPFAYPQLPQNGQYTSSHQLNESLYRSNAYPQIPQNGQYIPSPQLSEPVYRPSTYPQFPQNDQYTPSLPLNESLYRSNAYPQMPQNGQHIPSTQLSEPSYRPSAYPQFPQNGQYMPMPSPASNEPESTYGGGFLIDILNDLRSEVPTTPQSNELQWALSILAPAGNDITNL